MTTTSLLDTPRGRFGVRVQGAVDGGGRVVLCVHGFPDDASTFDGLGARLAAAGHRVVAMGLRGYAPSPLTGSLALDDLVEDLLAVAAAVSPQAPVHLVGHDYGAQLAYPAMARDPGRFDRAVLLSGAHPALVRRNAWRVPRQLWLSRYVVGFQLGRWADARVARDGFAYLDRLWRRWSPGFVMPAEHVSHVKETFRASMPGPVAMYRAGGFDVPAVPVDVPALFVTGADDGCARPALAHGQEGLFPRGYRAETWAGVGHYPHLEDPERTAAAVLEWFGSGGRGD